MQFCIAHLIRDIKYLTGLPDAATKAYGEKLLTAVKEMFKIIHLSACLPERVRSQTGGHAQAGITQGTRSKKGRETNERLWTVVGTCALQGRSAFEFILQAVHAYFQNDPAPSLLPGFT